MTSHEWMKNGQAIRSGLLLSLVAVLRPIKKHVKRMQNSGIIHLVASGRCWTKKARFGPANEPRILPRFTAQLIRRQPQNGCCLLPFLLNSFPYCGN